MVVELESNLIFSAAYGKRYYRAIVFSIVNRAQREQRRQFPFWGRLVITLEEGITTAKQLIDVEILYLLRESSQTLYSIRRALAESFGEDRSFGTIHPHLLKLEDQGLIKGLELRSDDGPYKRPLVLTRKGRSTLEKQVNTLAKMVIKMTMTAH